MHSKHLLTLIIGGLLTLASISCAVDERKEDDEANDSSNFQGDTNGQYPPDDVPVVTPDQRPPDKGPIVNPTQSPTQDTCGSCSASCSASGCPVPAYPNNQVPPAPTGNGIPYPYPNSNDLTPPPQYDPNETIPPDMTPYPGRSPSPTPPGIVNTGNGSVYNQNGSSQNSGGSCCCCCCSCPTTNTTAI